MLYGTLSYQKNHLNPLKYEQCFLNNRPTSKKTSSKTFPHFFIVGHVKAFFANCQNFMVINNCEIICNIYKISND